METAYGKTHAAHCMDVYLHNTNTIYENCTTRIIDEVTKALKPVRTSASEDEIKHAITVFLKKAPLVNAAVLEAKRRTIKYDELIPTHDDVEVVCNDYLEYIAEVVLFNLRENK